MEKVQALPDNKDKKGGMCAEFNPSVATAEAQIASVATPRGSDGNA